MYSNIPGAAAYVSQLIRYSRACGCYHDVLDRWLLLTRMLPWFNSELRREIRKRDRIRKTVKKHNKLLSTYNVYMYYYTNFATTVQK